MHLCCAKYTLGVIPVSVSVKLVAVFVLSRGELPTLAHTSRYTSVAAAAIARIIPTNHFSCSSELKATQSHARADTLVALERVQWQFTFKAYPSNVIVVAAAEDTKRIETKK